MSADGTFDESETVVRCADSNRAYTREVQAACEEDPGSVQDDFLIGDPRTGEATARAALKWSRLPGLGRSGDVQRASLRRSPRVLRRSVVVLTPAYERG